MRNKVQLLSGHGSEARCAPAEGVINVPGNRLELNARLAASLDAPVLMVLDANSATGVDDLVNKALVSRNGLTEERAEVMGLIVNKVSPPDVHAGPGLLSSSTSRRSSCIKLLENSVHFCLVCVLRCQGAARCQIKPSATKGRLAILC